LPYLGAAIQAGVLSGDVKDVLLLDIDANGVLNVSAQDKATGKEHQFAITATTNLGEREIEDLVREAKHHEAEDKQRKVLIDARNQADAMIYQIEKTLCEVEDQVAAADRGRIGDHLLRPACVIMAV
jgi:molecular chaperone DnaK